MSHNALFPCRHSGEGHGDWTLDDMVITKWFQWHIVWVSKTRHSNTSQVVWWSRVANSQCSRLSKFDFFFQWNMDIIINVCPSLLIGQHSFSLDRPSQIQNWLCTNRTKQNWMKYHHWMRGCYVKLMCPLHVFYSSTYELALFFCPQHL